MFDKLNIAGIQSKKQSFFLFPLKMPETFPFRCENVAKPSGIMKLQCFQGKSSQTLRNTSKHSEVIICVDLN